MSAQVETIVERWMIPRSGIPELVSLHYGTGVDGRNYYFFLGTAQIASPVFETERDALSAAVDRAGKAQQDAAAHYQDLLLRLSQAGEQ